MPKDLYSGSTAPLTSKRCILYIYSTNTGTEYFKHGIYCPFFSLQNAVCFIILTYLVPVLFTFYIQCMLKFKKYNSGAKRLRRHRLIYYNMGSTNVTVHLERGDLNNQRAINIVLKLSKMNSYNKSQLDALFLNFILIKNSTCFDRSTVQHQEFRHCIYSNRYLSY